MRYEATEPQSEMSTSGLHVVRARPKQAEAFPQEQHVETGAPIGCERGASQRLGVVVFTNSLPELGQTAILNQMSYLCT